MWRKSNNSENVRPLEKEVSGNNVILRKNFELVEASEDMPEHYEYDEWQMTEEQYEVYKYHEDMLNEQADALIELAELIAEVM